MTNLLPTTDYSGYACSVHVNGKPLPDGFQLISLQVKQGYQSISSAHIICKQTTGLGLPAVPGLNDLPVAGSPLTVKATLGSDEIVLFEGHIVRHKYKNSVQGTRFQITAKNKAVNMALSTSTGVFAGQSDKEVMDTITSGHGCTLTPLHLTTQFQVKHTQLVKNGISDWDFMNVRAEANGCFLYTESDKVILDMPTEEPDPTRIISALNGDNVYEIEVEQDERKYRVEKELISFNLSTLEPEITPEETDEASPTPSAVKGKHADINYRTFNDRECTELVNAASRLKALSRCNGLVRIKPNLTAKPGGTLAVSGFNELIDGKFIITAIMQDYSEGGFTTYLQFGLNHESYCCRYRLNTGQNRPVILTGLVTELQDDPDNLNRIRVKITHWKDAQEPLWARLSTLYAGDQHGLVMLPEIGDEVIVAFMGDDFDTPVILGSAFSPKFLPHTAFGNDNYNKALLTKKGMKWAWNDEKGVHEISTPRGNRIVISEEEKSIILEDQNANKIEMKDGEISLEGAKDVVIKANANVKISGTALELTASGNIKLEGSMVLIN